jgi:hypothetical protein
MTVFWDKASCKRRAVSKSIDVSEVRSASIIVLIIVRTSDKSVYFKATLAPRQFLSTVRPHMIL